MAAEPVDEQVAVDRASLALPQVLFDRVVGRDRQEAGRAEQRAVLDRVRVVAEEDLLGGVKAAVADIGRVEADAPRHVEVVGRNVVGVGRVALGLVVGDHGQVGSVRRGAVLGRQVAIHLARRQVRRHLVEELRSDVALHVGRQVLAGVDPVGGRLTTLRRPVDVLLGVGVADVEPGLVADDRAAERHTGLDGRGVVLVEGPVEGRRGTVRGGALVTVPAGLAVLDADEAAEVVGAALGHGVDDAADRTAVLRRVAGRLDLDLFDEVGHEVLAGQTVLRVGGVDTVDDEPVLGAGGAVDRQTADEAFLVDAGSLGGDAGEVTALREQLELLGGDRGGRGRAADVDLTGVGDDADRVADLTDLEAEVQRRGLTEGDDDVARLLRGEAVQLRRHRVGAGGDAGEAELADLVGRRRQAEAARAHRFDGRARKDRARGVGNDARDGAHLLLGARRHRQRERHEGDRGGENADVPPILVAHHQTSIGLIVRRTGTTPGDAGRIRDPLGTASGDPWRRPVQRGSSTRVDRGRLQSTPRHASAAESALDGSNGSHACPA